MLALGVLTPVPHNGLMAPQRCSPVSVLEVGVKMGSGQNGAEGVKDRALEEVGTAAASGTGS